MITSLAKQFEAIVGGANAEVEPQPSSTFLHERRGMFHGLTPLLLRPGSVDEVAAILRLANMTGTAVVPQGGNTGLVGGQIPDQSGTQVLLSLGRLNTVRSVDPVGDAMIVEAGVTLAGARAAASEAGRLFPLALGSMDACQIGGNLSTNAGGVAVLAYGNSRDLMLGLEVVLADGQVLEGLRSLRKDNSGYDLKHLFIGAEGSLGVITAATLKLFPRPKGKATAIAGVTSPRQALALFHVARARVALELTSFELMPRICIDFCLRHVDGAFDPMAKDHDWYALFDVSSGRSAVDAIADIERILEHAKETGLVTESVIANSDEESAALWRMRLSLSDVQRPEGASIKHDISVPISAVPDFIETALDEVTKLVPGCRPVPFGHLGDGNIHFNISQPDGGDERAFLARRGDLNRLIYDLVAEHGGSIAAEHGVGQMKRDLLPLVRSEVELGLMRKLKRTLDPNGILNPGKVL